MSDFDHKHQPQCQSCKCYGVVRWANNTPYYYCTTCKHELDYYGWGRYVAPSAIEQQKKVEDEADESHFHLPYPDYLRY